MMLSRMVVVSEKPIEMAAQILPDDQTFVRTVQLLTGGDDDGDDDNDDGDSHLPSSTSRSH